MVCAVFIYLAYGVADNYAAHHTRTFKTVSADEAEKETYRIDLNNESGVKITLPAVSHNNYVFLRLSPNDTYKIVFYNGNKKTSSFVVDSGPWASLLDGAGHKPVLHLIPAHIAKEGYTSFAIFPIRGDGEYIAANIRTENFEEKPRNFQTEYNVIDFEIKQLEIEIKDKNFEKIQKKRDEALKLGVLLADDEDKVPAKIRADGKNYNAEARLKGDVVDHLEGDKWSFRIELKGDFCVYGMQKFSVQSPEARNNLYERMIYEWYREQGGVALRYDFVDVFLNGEYKGVYALEEFMEKRVIEHSRKREGPIIKFDENTHLWEPEVYYAPIFYAPKLKNEIEKTDKWVQNFLVFSEKKTVVANNLSGYAQYGIDQINRVWARNIPVEEVFDLELYAKLLVILDLFEASHGRELYNSRHYYNPVTALLEPLPFDEFAFEWHYPFSFLVVNYGQIPGILFENPEFRSLYKKSAEKIFAEADTFLDAQKESLRQYETTLRRDMYNYSLNTDFITVKIESIKTFLNGERLAPSAAIVKSSDSCSLTITNNDSAPIVITGLYDGSGSRLEIKGFPMRIFPAFKSNINSVWNSMQEVSLPQLTGSDTRNLTLSFRYYFVDEEQFVSIEEALQ
jgi:hypothetical protein